VFGAPGAGGSFAFADPDARLGHAYVMNEMDFYLSDDPREKPLRSAVDRAITRLSTASSVFSPTGMPLETTLI
jgi:CubicO group peptidase (beta-lactamase class C family)